MASPSDDRSRYDKTSLTEQESAAIPRYLEYLAKNQKLIQPEKLGELGWYLSWEPFKSRLHPCVRQTSGNKIVSPFPDWKLGDPINVLIGPVLGKPFVLTTSDMTEDGKLSPGARQVIAANAHDGNDLPFEILRKFLEDELAQQFAAWDTPGEDGEQFSRDAEKNLLDIRDPDNTKFYSAIGPKSEKYGDGIKLRCNVMTSNPDSERGLDHRSKENMKQLPEDEQETIKRTLAAENYTKRYQPMEITDTENNYFDARELRAGATIGAVYSFFACQTRSTKKGKAKVSGGTVCRRCSKIIVFANGPSDSFSTGGKGLADFFAKSEPEPKADPVAAEPSPGKSSENRKRKLEILAAKQKRVKAKRDKEDGSS